MGVFSNVSNSFLHYEIVNEEEQENIRQSVHTKSSVAMYNVYLCLVTSIRYIRIDLRRRLICCIDGVDYKLELCQV